MTSGIRFESANLLEERRSDLREAREKILDKAKSKYEKEERKKEQARLRGEDKWMLPSVDSRLTKESKEFESKKKKLKKEKKEKKKKKKKKKSKKSSSDESDEDEEEWVESGTSGNTSAADNEAKPVIKGPTMPQRESWMEAPLELLPLMSRQEIRDKKQAEVETDDKKESVIEQMGQHARELNPYWKDGGTGLPSQNVVEEKSGPRIGDGGAEWLKKAYVRCKEQAREEGRSFEELATERWGSVEKIEKMIADAEKMSRSSSSSNYKESSRGSDRRTNFRRPTSPKDDEQNFRSERSRRFQRPGSPGEDRERGKDYRDRDRRDRDSDNSRDRDNRDRYRDYNRDRDTDRDSRFKERDSDKSRAGDRDRDNCRARSRDRDTYSARNRDRDNSRGDRDTDKYKNTDRDRKRFQRPSFPEDNDDRKSGSSRFRRPGSRERERTTRSSRSPDRQDRDRERRDGYQPKTAGTQRWKKQSAEEIEARNKPEKSFEQSNSKNTRKSKSRSPSSSSESSSQSSSSDEEEEETLEAPEPIIVLTEAEMNALAAKILKAEIMGDEGLASDLKSKLEQAREARKNAPPPPPSKTTEEEEKEVLLTRTTKTGLVVPLSEAKHPKEPKRGRKRQKKVETHEDGKRKRYFDDDDKLDLKTMVERERMGTAEDQNSMFARLAGRSVEKTDDDYQMDDMFISKAAKQQSESKLEEKDKLKAIMEHQKMSSSIAKCQFCFDKVPKHLIIAIGRKSYLCLPQHKPLTTGHCLIVPMAHCPSATAMDEDVWQEMQNFRKTLVNLFTERGEDTVFMETSMYLRKHPHTYIECVPMEREIGDLAPIYFKKAIQECESEWSQNKKLVDLSKKDIKHAVPKGFPYFCVDFGLQGGFAHVIEDEQRFPSYFGREIVGGMVDANHRLWKNPPKESFDEQRLRVLEFSDWWKPHDWTQNIG